MTVDQRQSVNLTDEGAVSLTYGSLQFFGHLRTCYFVSELLLPSGPHGISFAERSIH
jgi:hypothetical protein